MRFFAFLWTSTRSLPDLPSTDGRGLILTVGLPRAGKSTWAKEQGFPIVNLDSIRLSLHGKPFIPKWEPIVLWAAKLMVHSLFWAGHEYVILDATSINPPTRAKWASNGYQLYAHEFPTPAVECRRRARECGQDYLIPVIDRMEQEYEPPSNKEPRIQLWCNRPQ